MSVRQIVPGVVAHFREELIELVETALADEMTPTGFVRMVESLKAILSSVGRRAFAEMVAACEEHGDMVEHCGKGHRFKQVVAKEWLTPFGCVQMDRRYFQQDAGGEGLAPLDLHCGMSDRYMTPDIEEAVALASADLSPSTTRCLLEKLLPQAPSDKAIRRLIADVGEWAESESDEIEYRVAEAVPMPQGDTLVVSVDGVTVPLRQEGVKTGRPAERPGIRESNQTKTVWREAGVGTISIYRAGDGDERRPERLATKYMARMPEAGMKTLFAQQGWAVWELTREREFEEIVVICDGKPSLWNRIEADPSYESATLILDFFHVAEHLSKAAEAIFGKKKRGATRWYDKYRALLRDDPGGFESVLRSLRYYRRSLGSGGERYKVVSRVIRYFHRNRGRMRYPEFRARGLPIGSGVVEAACKTIVGARLKRSGMRWSQDGAQHVLNLRTRAKSGEWSTFWTGYLELRNAA